MAFEQKDGQGSLFKNDRKEPGSKQPDYRGDCNINGEIMEIAAWIKQSSNGKNFMSLSFKPKEDYKPKAEKKVDEFDEDLPF